MNVHGAQSTFLRSTQRQGTMYYFWNLKDPRVLYLLVVQAVLDHFLSQKCGSDG